MANKKTTTKSAKTSSKKPVKNPPKTTKNKKPETKAKEKVTKVKATKESTNKNWLAWLIACIGVAAIIAVVAVLLCTKKTDPSDPTAAIKYSDAFFIYDGKYSLWNADGKRLTEDEYGSHSNFINGYAYVEKDGQYGIIRDDGRMSVDFGKYGDIDSDGGLYVAQDGNTKEEFLLTGDGRELERGDDLETDATSSYSGFATVKNGNAIKAYTYEGKVVAEAEVKEDADDPELDSSHDFGLFCYDNRNVVFDARDAKVLADFEGPCYEFDMVLDSREKILIENSEESGQYKLLTGGKVYDLNETKNYAMTDEGTVVGYDDYSAISLLDDDYKVSKKVDIYIDIKDWKNYAAKNDDGKVEIIKNGEVVKTFGDESSVPASGSLVDDNYYAIKDGDVAMFYNLDGSVAFNHEFKTIRSLFDKHHHAVVSDDEEDYYLIDNKGNRIGDVAAKSISLRDGGYELRNGDGRYAIANKDGKPVTDFKYSSVYYRSDAEPRNIWTGYNGSEEKKGYDVINADTGEMIIENADIGSFYSNYFTVKNKDDKTDYYTYSGDLFYTTK